MSEACRTTMNVPMTAEILTIRLSAKVPRIIDRNDSFDIRTLFFISIAIRTVFFKLNLDIKAI